MCTLCNQICLIGIHVKKIITIRKQSITPIDQRDEEEEDRVAKQLLPQKFPQGALPPEEKNFHLMKKHTKLPPEIK